MNVIFNDFWESHRSDYIPEFEGDVTKSFLGDIALQLLDERYQGVVLTSVYKRVSFNKKVLRKLLPLKKNNNLTLYGQNVSSDPVPGFYNIWYSAENIRPPLSQKFDYYLSFDLDDYKSVNSYLPLWLCRLGPTLDLANRAQELLMEPRIPGPLRQKDFCVVASNPEQIRNHFISRLNNEACVDIFGKLGSAISNKNETLQKYNLNICFENDLYPGYVTEKAIESYISGCIPVWRGLDPLAFLNQNAIIDVTNLSIEDGIRRVLEISADKELMQHMRSQPILNNTINLKKLILDMKESTQIS